MHYLSTKGNGKGQGKGDTDVSKGGGFNGNCLWCRRPGHRLRECREYTRHLQKGREPIGAYKGKGKGDGGKRERMAKGKRKLQQRRKARRR